MDIATLVTVITQLGMAGAAWRLASQVSKRLDATDKTVDLQGQRLGVLEMAIFTGGFNRN